MDKLQLRETFLTGSSLPVCLAWFLTAGLSRHRPCSRP